jgi:nucleoside-diphosphate-sugar epimerase
VEARAGDIARSVAAVDKAQQVLGFAARAGLVEGLSATLSWYREVRWAS